MKKCRFTDEQIIGFLNQAEAGMPVKELCRLGGFSDATFYKRRAKFGGRPPVVSQMKGIVVIAASFAVGTALSQPFCEPVPVDVEFPAGFVGAYEIIGKNPVSGDPYKGTLQVSEQEGFYGLRKSVPGRSAVQGSAQFQRCGPDRILSLAISYQGAVPSTGSCVVHADGDNYYRVSCRTFGGKGGGRGLESWFQVE